MSGGVDSSVTAALLKERGFKVVGVHLKCWNIDGCAAQDAEDARRAAESLDIPFYVFDFEQEYRDRVVEYMVDGYRKGITPNPDVVCNQEIKFGLFYKRAMSLGADFVATGHYVRLGRRKASSTKHQVPNKSGRHSEQGEESIFELYAATDKDKDQSYFLWTLTQKQLAHCLFPLGDFIKRTQVRKLAKKYKLPNATKKDSQGICFLGQVSLPEFLSEFIPQRKGAIINAAGKQVGEHQGAYYYTIGQRRGLGVGGSPVPLYVAEKDVKKNTITVAPEGDESLLSSSITLSAVNLINSKLKHSNILQNVGMSVWCRVRYRQPLLRAHLIKKGTRWSIKFAKPQKFVAPGQSAVFYRATRSAHSTSSGQASSGSKSENLEMLGGGVIQSAI